MAESPDWAYQVEKSSDGYVVNLGPIDSECVEQYIFQWNGQCWAISKVTVWDYL